MWNVDVLSWQTPKLCSSQIGSKIHSCLPLLLLIIPNLSSEFLANNFLHLPLSLASAVFAEE
jgi:hypothetical protein